jgi:4-hydroxybenzoate polyprenyltransferase
MTPYLRLLRPKQWVKNLFLFAALIFSHHLFATAYLLLSIKAFVVFCFVSSAAYVLNDVVDVDADRLHPIKRNRPIASNAVSPRNAIFFGLLLLGIAAALSSSLPREFAFAVAVYVAFNVGYTFGLKRVVLVDVFIIGAGFLIRVVAGAYAINVEVSHWLILCTLFISLFLAVSKRRAELLLNELTASQSGRAVLKDYDVHFVDQMMTIVASGTVISYALYSVAERTVLMFGTENLVFTTVFVLFGTFRYLFLVQHHTTEDNPTALLLSDPPMLVNIALWFITCVGIIYGGSASR